MKLRIGICVLVSGLLSFTVQGQILDDTSRNVYGPKTTKYLYKQNLRYNEGGYRTVDTLLNNHHKFDLLSKTQNKYQDLGGTGTAALPIFSIPPHLIGATSGFNAYNVYYKENDLIRYYDTKSPFIDLFIKFGGGGRSIVNIDFSRNINSQWNFGGDVRVVNIDKQVDSRFRGDRLVESSSYDLYTQYKTKDSTYRVMASFSRMFHKVFESGGIITDHLDSLKQKKFYKQLFDSDALNWLENATSQDLRQNYHLYHQLHISNLIQVYHAIDKNKQVISFDNTPLDEDSTYWDQILIDEDTTRDRSRFRELRNELGIKGDIGKIFYNLYYKRRDIRQIPRYLRVIETFTENYIGFDTRIGIIPGIILGARGEFLDDGKYKAEVSIRQKWLTGRIGQVKYQPSFLVQDYFGNHDEWHNQFDSPIMEYLKAEGHINFWKLLLQPHLSLSRIDNHIFFNLEAEPEQVDGSAEIISVGMNYHLNFARVMHVDQDLIFTTVSGTAKDVFPIPKLFINGSIYYEGDWFGDNIHVQTGFDLHWRSRYFAMAYDPVVQQFHLQQDFRLPDYALVDLFFNFKILRARFFIKFTNLLQGLQAEGYQTTPFYQAQNRVFDLGVNWQFYN